MKSAPRALTRRVVVVSAATCLVVTGGAFAQSKSKPADPSLAPIPSPTNFLAFTVQGADDANPLTGLPDHTVYRPTDLTRVHFKMPVIAWANGGCRRSSMEFYYLLANLASYGYFIVANGNATYPFLAAELDGLATPDPGKLIRGINWALAENEDRRSPFYRRLDPSRVVVMGQSCGGREAGAASADRRVSATVLFNPQSCAPVDGTPSVGTPIPPRDACLARMHAPTLWVSGGPNDLTYNDAASDYASGRHHMPAVWADNPAVEHTGMFDEPGGTGPKCCADGTVYQGGGISPAAHQNEPLLLTWRWLSFVLYNDKASRSYFLGRDCGLCRRPGWSVKSKDWNRWAPAR